MSSRTGASPSTCPSGLTRNRTTPLSKRWATTSPSSGAFLLPPIICGGNIGRSRSSDFSPGGISIRPSSPAVSTARWMANGSWPRSYLATMPRCPASWIHSAISTPPSTVGRQPVSNWPIRRWRQPELRSRIRPMSFSTWATMTAALCIRHFLICGKTSNAAKCRWPGESYPT